MGETDSCELILKIAKSKNYPAKTSRQTITLVAPATTVATATTVAPRIYSVGETGPGGGIVFYDAGTTQAWGRYLEAAPTDYQEKGASAFLEYGCKYTAIGATATAIGYGKANTAKMLEKCTTAYNAAEAANKYSTSMAAAGQWFVPSKDELNQMYLNRAAIGGFRTDVYLSSSEADDYRAWVQIFSTIPVPIIPTLQRKNEIGYLRPIRAF